MNGKQVERLAALEKTIVEGADNPHLTAMIATLTPEERRSIAAAGWAAFDAYPWPDPVAHDTSSHRLYEAALDTALAAVFDGLVKISQERAPKATAAYLAELKAKRRDAGSK